MKIFRFINSLNKKIIEENFWIKKNSQEIDYTNTSEMQISINEMTE